MELQSALKIQRAWRSYRDTWICIACPNRLKLREYEVCDDCWNESYYSNSRHCCGDWLCNGGCGVLRCGCIDVCRCRYDRW